eukprot:CAMPEP_0168532282 /NCGR_PEP_ID=MMETSP0405-20121227/16112_1 /TAXON_ID=498012 /ORGANISM="Trichosphaerium sp, Strain Am-I-7 wt" /LENGTH=68 /DNA_ID=CAMNT_0008557569 /DNA_START=25 /DNA_END=231 /DNA_ORIENTATION=+
MTDKVMKQEPHRTYIEQPKKKVFHPEEAKKEKELKANKKQQQKLSKQSGVNKHKNPEKKQLIRSVDDE